ncbi:MAG: dTMP kinase [Catenulisporales bacterium]|nr:dTMP kinase [Catenulisporales bacterium]
MESHPPGVRAALAIPDFRRLWTALSLSSLGDWLGLLAQSSLAVSLAGNGYAGRSYAVAGVFVLRLVPAILFGPIAGVAADRLDRRLTMVAGDGTRCLLFISIPLVGTLWWLLAATFLIEIAAMFWIPAKEATVPNLVPPRLLESANQISLLTAYGTAPLAAGVFTGLALVTRALAGHWAFLAANPVDLALYFDALTFLFSALTIARLKSIPASSATERAARRQHRADNRSVLRTLLDGWRYLAADNHIRGVIIGTTGAFAAGGAVVGLARTYVDDLGAGQAAYGVLFGAVFLGLAAGMATGSRVWAGVAREHLFGAVICGAGMMLCAFALVPSLLVGLLCALVVGFLGGTAWIIGQTMLGREVADELRGRTFAFVQSLIRVTLVLILAAAPAVAGTVGSLTLRFPGPVSITYGGAAITLFGAGLLAAGVGWVAYRMMDDVPGKSLRNELRAALKRTASSTRAMIGGSGAGNGTAARPGADTNAAPDLPPDAGSPDRIYPGTFISFEGGDGSGKSTQLAALADWLRGRGHEVVVTREPGGTPLGTKLREIVLDARNAGSISPRAEALLYAADRADHVERVVRPALARGAVVLTDRYLDSSLAYQGAGRALSPREVERLSRWATQGLMPDVTILLDLDPVTAATRRTGPADRLELESVEFHRRVRDRYLELAAADPQRFVVIDAAEPVEQITGRIRARLETRVHLSQRERDEAAARQEAEAAMLARARVDQLAQLSEEEQRQAIADTERLERERAEQAAREVTQQALLQRLEQDAARIEREAAERARRAAEQDLASNIAQADKSAASPEQIAAAARSAAQAQAQARARAEAQARAQAEAQTRAQAEAQARLRTQAQALTQPQTKIQAEAVDLAAPTARSEWEVPDYIAEPELDDTDDIDSSEALSLTDELLGARRQPRPRSPREDS